MTEPTPESCGCDDDPCLVCGASTEAVWFDVRMSRSGTETDPAEREVVGYFCSQEHMLEHLSRPSAEWTALPTWKEPDESWWGAALWWTGAIVCVGSFVTVWVIGIIATLRWIW